MPGSIFNGQLMALKWCVQILGLLWILLGKADFVLLMKAHITRKNINFPKFFFPELCKGWYQQLITIFNLVKTKKQ